MPRVVGIDPGSSSFDIRGLEDGLPFLDESLPSSEVARRPEAVLKVLAEAGRLDLIAGPSGYGLPLVPIERVGEPELRLLCLAESGSGGGVGGLRTLVRLLREARLPVVFTPGVIHLSTVPAHRKVNRIDLGTADKVCAAAAAIDDQARRFVLPHADTAFVLVELGGAFTAVLAVDAGRIVSGQGGSSGPLGYRASGALDAEVACLLGRVSKETVFSGGVAYVAGEPGAPADELAARQDEAFALALEAFVESLLRAVAGELAAVPRAREILLSGRLCRIPRFRDPVVAALSVLRPVRSPEPGTKVKEAAAGAAMIADGLAGGRYRQLVSTMRLQDACGTVLDRIYLAGASEASSWLQDPARC